MLKKEYTTLEMKICSEVAKTIKSMVGRGPNDIRAVFIEEGILIFMSGHLFPLEKQIGQTENGFFDIKFNRIKLTYAFREHLLNIVSEQTGRKIGLFLHDIDPAVDTSVMAFMYK